jgi:hypothetical protein
MWAIHNACEPRRRRLQQLIEVIDVGFGPRLITDPNLASRIGCEERREVMI